LVRVHVTYHHDPDTGHWTGDSPDQPTLHATGHTLTDCRNDAHAVLGRLLDEGSYRVFETIRLGPPPGDQP
jgi:predicted RNase H-like HicB family nuclease